MDAKTKPLVVYIEDDEDDQELCRIVLEDVNIEMDFRFIGDGQSASEYIDRLALNSSPEDRPALILLDLSMPAINGWDLLRKFRSIESLTNVPLVVFTTSNSPSDRNQAYAEGANAYTVKPAGLKELGDYFDITLSYWLKFACPENNI